MKYNRTYHLPYSPGACDDDKIASDQRMLIGTEIVITEKLDGENCGLIKEGVYARSHASFTVSPWSKEVRQIHSNIGYQIPEGVYLFGENMEGIHSIEYERLESYFYLFGVREMGPGEPYPCWLSWKDVEEYAFLLDLKIAPVLFRGTVSSETELKSLVESLCSQPSFLGGKREGVVVRYANKFPDDDFELYVQKWVRANHVQTDEHWTRNWKKAKLWDISRTF